MDNPAQSAVAEVEVAAHTISLPRGTYCIYVLEVSDSVPQDKLPGLGVSAAPGEEGGAVEVARLAGESWLRRRGDSVLVRVHASEIRLLLTSYNYAKVLGATPPKIEVQRLDPSLPVKSDAAELSGKAQLLVHIREHGDQLGRFGDWIGEPGDDRWIEGFSILPPPGFQPGDLEYRAVLGKGWLSPWVRAGEYCGSRGMQLPILGVQTRLSDAAMPASTITVAAIFADGSTQGPVPAGETCAAEPLQPVVALRIEVSANAAMTPAPDPAPRRRSKAPVQTSGAKPGAPATPEPTSPSSNPGSTPKPRRAR